MISGRILINWLERLDPGAHRRVKGLRLVTAYALAAMMGRQLGLSRHLTIHALPGADQLGWVAAGFALWASVSEARDPRRACSQDLALLVLAAVIGAVSMILLGPVLSGR